MHRLRFTFCLASALFLVARDGQAQTPVTFSGNGANWTINQSGLTSANITSNVFYGTDGNGGESITAWCNRPVFIDGFSASFLFQDVGGVPGNNADGFAFNLQESGPTFLGSGGGNLGINGLSPSANWEFNLYQPNTIGAIFHTSGIAYGYQGTGAVNLSSGDPIQITIVYTTGGAVTETLQDTVTAATFTTNYDVGDLVGLLGSSVAYLGFSSADGGASSIQTISNFSFVSATNLLNQGGAVLTSFPAEGVAVPALRSVEIHFDEAVSGVAASDLLIDNVAATNVTEYAPWQYVFEFPEPPAGAVTVGWATNAQVVSVAGQTNVALGGNWGYSLHRALPPPTLQISEFMAANQNTIKDSFGDSSDWIEIYNGTSVAVNLAGWHLSAQSSNLTQWAFPNYVLASGDYLVVFASGRNLAAVTNELHTNFKLSAAGSFLALVSPQTNLVSFFAPAYPGQQTDVSYGVDPALLSEIGFFTTPTPGDANATVGAGFAPEPVFSRAGGTFSSPFYLIVNGGVSNAVVRYTVDGSAPADLSPVLAGPLLVTNSVQVRARSFANGLLPGVTHSETYVQLASDAAATASDLPALVIYNFGAGVPNTAVDAPDQFANFSFFEPSNGVTSLTNAPTLSARAGFHVHGSSTRGFTKQSWSVSFWDELNNNADAAPLELPDGKDWVLYAPDSFEPVLIHNPLLYQLSREIGRYAPRTRMLEVYINTTGGPVTSSDYNGIYVLEEKIRRASARVDIDKLNPDDNTAPTVTGGYLLGIDRLDPGDNGLNAASQTIVYDDPEESDILTPERAPQAAYIQNYMNNFWAALNSSSYTNPVTGYAGYIDVPSWIDTHILNVVAFNVDALRLSASFYKPRQGPIVFGPIWDFDRSQGSTDGRDFNPYVWRAYLNDGGTDFFNYTWWGALFTDPDFWQKWIDRYQNLRGGVLSTNHLFADIDALAAQVRNEEPREIARWPGWTTPRNGPVSYGTSFSYTFPGTYDGEVAFLKQWFTDRFLFIDTNLLAQPAFFSNAVSGSSQWMVTLAGPPNSTVCYTLDGTDPRLAGGAVSPAAFLYEKPISVISNTVITARALDYNHHNLTGANNPPVSSPWSGPVTATFGVVTAPTAVAYNSPGSIYAQNFDSLPDPGAASVNTANPVTIAGVTYALPNPYGFALPIGSTSAAPGGLGLPDTMPGWYGLASPTASVGPRFGATDGDQTTGGQVSFGAPNGSNRALGLLATSTTGYTAFGLRLINGSSQALNQMSVRFTGELWRQSNLAKTLEFYYLIDSSGTNAFSTNATAFLHALDVQFPTASGVVGGAAVDGTVSVNQTNLTVTNQTIANWAPGAALWLVWEMASPAGNSQGLAIDNLSFSATAAPTNRLSLSIQNVASQGSSPRQFALSWPNSGAAWQLYSATNLTPPVTWSLQSGATTPSNGAFYLTIPATNKAQFYRLMAP